MATAENPHAGQGAVLLDIGGDIGALIVEMPPHMVDLEVEIIPTGTDRRAAVHDLAPGREHDHAHLDQNADGSPNIQAHPHSHGPDGEHTHPHTHSHDDAAPPHVAVVARPTPDGRIIHSLVYGEVLEGSYDLYVRPHGPIRVTATVKGGEVTETRWPDWPTAG